MLIEDLVKYYADYRIYCYNRGDKLKGIEFRKKIHPLINLILKIDQILSKEKIIVISDRSNIRLNEPKIFACTHVTPNEIVMKTFTGTVRMAKETGVEIVPIAVEQYNNIFYFNIGKNYTIDKNTNVTDAELNADLRDKLATLKWEIMETQPKFDRTMISNDYLDVFQSEIVGRCNYGYGFSLEDAISESFHDKNITKFEDAFAHLDNIEFDARNAFLLGGSPKKIKRK